MPFEGFEAILRLLRLDIRHDDALGRWKMAVTGGLESLAARCQRATVHGLTVQSADVAVVQACSGRRRCSRWRVAVPILVLIEV